MTLKLHQTSFGSLRMTPILRQTTPKLMQIIRKLLQTGFGFLGMIRKLLQTIRKSYRMIRKLHRTSFGFLRTTTKRLRMSRKFCRTNIMLCFSAHCKHLRRVRSLNRKVNHEETRKAPAGEALWVLQLQTLGSRRPLNPLKGTGGVFNTKPKYRTLQTYLSAYAETWRVL